MTAWGDIMKRLDNFESKNNTVRAAGTDPGWYCMKPNCLYAEKGFINYATRRHCNGCYLPREVAERPPPPARARVRERQVQVLQGADISSSELAATTEKKKEKRRLKNAARQAWNNKASKDSTTSAPAPVAAIPSEGQAPGPVAVAMANKGSPATPSVKNKLSIPEDLKTRLPLLGDDVLKFVTDSLALETVPSQIEAKSPESIMLKALGDRGPAAKVAKVSELQANIAAYKTMILTAQSNGDTMNDVEVVLQEKLEAAETALAKAQKDAPSQLSELRDVQESRSSHELNAQTRKDLQQKGLAKALERKTARHAHIKQLKDQLDVLDAGLTELEDKNYQAHAARAAALTEIDNKVFALFDARIAALQQGPQNAAQPNPPPPGQLALPQSPTSTQVPQRHHL